MPEMSSASFGLSASHYSKASNKQLVNIYAGAATGADVSCRVQLHNITEIGQLTGVKFGDGELLQVGDERHHGQADPEVARDLQRPFRRRRRRRLRAAVCCSGGGVEAEEPRRLEGRDAALHVAREDEDVGHPGDLQGRERGRH